MHDTQIVSRLGELHENLAELFERTRCAQRKPSRQHELFETSLPQALGAGITLAKHQFATGYRPAVEHVVPDTLRALTHASFPNVDVVIEVSLVDAHEEEFGMRFMSANVPALQLSNATHRLSSFLEGIAKLDRRAFNSYWAARNPQLAEKDSALWGQWMACVLGVVGGLNSTIRLR